METLIPSLVFGVAAVASLLVTDAVRRYAIAKEILDVPNDRSLHSSPIPRGGGIGIALVTFGAIIVLAGTSQLPANVAMALLGGVAVATIGWIDDKRGVSSLVRALVHFSAAAWAMYWLGGFQTIDVGAGAIRLGSVGYLWGVLTIVWLTNLYNFMDGIDGLAASEAVWVAAAGGVLLLAEGASGLGIVALSICGGALGFLIRNWSPARIFMGDVASSLLGFLFAVIAIASERAGTLPFLAWMILLGVFVLDSTVTLLRRVAHGAKWYDAHRMHGYQRLVEAGWTHARVTSGVVVVNFALTAVVLSTVVWRWLLTPGLALATILLGAIYARIERLAPFHKHER
jgi:glycosyltransferase WbpL